MEEKEKELRDALERLEKCCPGSTCGLSESASGADLHEALLDLGRARRREQKLREESDALLEGMNIIIGSEDTRTAFRSLLAVLRNLLGFDDAFVLREQDNGSLATVASSSPLYESLVWQRSAMFRHVFSGNSVNLRDIGTSTDWQGQPPDICRNVASALHTPFHTATDRAVMVCTSSREGFFDKPRIDLLKRFTPLAGQALYNIEISDHLRDEINERKQAEQKLEEALTSLRKAKEELTRANAALSLENRERQKAEEALRSAYDDLEIRIKQRTFELQTSNRLLHREILVRKNAEEDKEKMFAQLIQAQKMESIGQLAGGVAHDFNNILTTILGYSQVIMLTMKKDDPILSHIEAIHEAGERASSLTRQLLAFSRKQVMEMRVVNLNTLITNMTKMLGRLIGEKTEMKLLLGSSIGNIKADTGQIEQVIMNLAVNAKDAMPDGGHLTLKTETVSVSEEDTFKRAGLMPGEYVMLSVEDTGMGMTKEVREEIFEPFFTTKERDKGTGLGLATVYGIVKQHNGNIYVDSEPGQGARFTIYLPVTEEEVPEPEHLLHKQKALRISAETVLVVDDDPSIRRLVVNTLTPLGYSCLSAASGEEALSLAKTSDKTIDLLLTDVVMPGMNGPELARHFRKQFPDSGVIFMSGYLSKVDINTVLSGEDVFLQKPFTLKDLLNKFGEVLGT